MLDDISRRRDFPSLAAMTYLNTAAEGIPPLVVRAALDQYFRDKQLGMDGREPHFREWEAAKASAARWLGLTPDEVTICSCSSEAFNLAATALRLQPGDEVVINDLDFPAGATPWLQADSPARARVWASRNGSLALDDLIPLLGPRTRLVTLSLVSFFNGFKVDLPPVIAAVRRHCPALVAVDVTQALGRISLDLSDVDLVISSTHKWILASHGGGIVGVPAKRARDWTTSAGGWFHLEDAFGPDRFQRAISRPGAASFTVGMPNFPAIYAIRAGLDYLEQVGVTAIERVADPLVRQCLAGLCELPVELLSPTEPARLAGILAFRHPRADELHAALLRERIHVMHSAGRIRIALHGYNTAADVDQLLSGLRTALDKLGPSVK